MKLRDFRFGWRTLVQEPAYSWVVIAGLGIGFATSLLLLGFVRYSWQYNAHVPDAERVYVIKQRDNIGPKAPWFDQAPLLLRAAAAKVPGVAGATGYIPSRPKNPGLTVNIDGQLRQLESLTVLPGFADMLGIQVVQGDLKAALEQPETFAISEEAAIRLFGTADALGRTLLAEGKLLRAGAIVRTPPTNTTIPFEALVGVNSLLTEAEEGMREELLSGAKGWWGKLLLRTHPDASLAAITASLQQTIDTTPSIQKLEPAIRQRLGARKVMDVALVPLRDAYFDRDVAENHITAPGDRADRTVVAGLGAIAVLILALAAINYVNLAAVRVLRRQREVAMRKVLGAGARQIVLQSLAESLLVAMLAAGLGLLLAWIALPLFSELMNRKLEGILSPANIGVALALGGVLGVLTAAYPAWIALCVRPNQVLAGRADTESTRSMQLRRVMTVVQVATAMGFAGVTIAIGWQTVFAMGAAPGFDPAPMVIVDLPEPVRDGKHARGFIAELAAQPGVAGIAVSQDAIGRHNDAWFRDLQRPGAGSAPTEIKPVSVNFFEQYRIKPLAGRLFDSSLDKDNDPASIVLNAIAARELGFATPAAAVGQTVLFTEWDGKVVHKRVLGVAPELRFQSLREAPRAMGYEPWTYGMTLSVRAHGTPSQVEEAIRAVWPRYYPDAILKTHRAADILSVNYADDARIAKLLAVATAIALAIAAFGTYVLSAHTVQRRAKEIVMRRLHGARRPDIGLMVVREIGWLTLASAAIGLPLAALAIERYLAGFVEHAPIGYWTLLFAFISTLAIALAAVARHAWIAMRMMPSDALR